MLTSQSISRPGISLGGRSPRATPRRGRSERFQPEQVLTALLFLLPAVIVIGIFVIYPIISAGHISLTSWNGFTADKPFVGFANYVHLAQDPEFWNSLLVTCIYGVGVCVLSVGTGLAVALLLDKPIRARAFYRGVYFLPVVMSSVAAAVVWKYLLDPAGLINNVLAHLGVAGPDWLQNRWLALGALTLLTVWKNVGFNAILYLTALQALPESIYEAAQVDGATAWQRTRMLTIPLLSPMTFFVVVQALITSFQAFDLVYVLTGGGPQRGTQVLGLFMYNQTFTLGNFGYGTAIAFVTLALVLGVTAIQWRVSGSGKSALR